MDSIFLQSEGVSTEVSTVQGTKSAVAGAAVSCVGAKVDGTGEPHAESVRMDTRPARSRR